LRLHVGEILHNCRLFSAVGAPGFQRLAAISRLSKFAKGQMIFREGDDCPGVYVVGTGLVRVFKVAPNAKEHVLHIVGPGGTFAEVAAIGGFECPANAEAVAPTTCALLPVDLFKKALEEDHPLCLEVMTGLTLWVRHLVTIIEDIALRDAAGRLARYLLESQENEDGTIELPSLKRHLASHLNLTSETFSRTIRRLIEAGLIAELGRGGVRLVDRKKLRLVAEGLFPEE
jgi:CRP-like cAMP-binding protein